MTNPSIRTVPSTSRGTALARLGGALAVVLGLTALLAAHPQARAASDPALNSLLDQARTARSGSSGSGDDFLPVDQAFRFSSGADGARQVHLSWAIAPGYYLYRDRIKITNAASGAEIGAPQFPPGVVKQDDYFGKQVVYHNALVATVPVTRADASLRELTLRVTYQGCAEAGLCYPPMTRTVSIQLPPAGSGAIGGGAAGAVSEVASSAPAAAVARAAASVSASPAAATGATATSPSRTGSQR